MKKGVWVGAIVVFVVLLGGYVVALPYITIININTSVQDHDQGKMAEYINFPVLRDNFRQQLGEQLIESSVANVQDNDSPYDTVKIIGLSRKMADEITRGLITPAGLKNIMVGEKLLRDGIAVFQQTAENRKISKATKYSFDGINSFSAWVKNDHDEDVTFVLTRNGLSWKLTNIIFPIKCNACHEKRSI